MTNFDFSIKSYKQLIETRPEDGNIEYMKQQIIALESVNHKSDEEIDTLFNTGVFNDICKGYCKMALTECEISESKIEAVMDTLRWLFDTTPPSTARKHS